VTIRFECTACGKQLRIPESSAGKRGKCPACGTTLSLPEGVYDAEVVGLDDEVGAEGLLAVDELANPADSSEEGSRRPCSACGEMIVSSAAKCRFCGEIFDPELARIEAKKKKKGRSSVDEDMSTGDWIAAVLCSGIGCIAGIVWMIQGKPKGLKMTGVSILFAFIWGIIKVAAQEAGRR